MPDNACCVILAGASFLACTPERLYVRSGRQVASEAVAGTRPRGPPGDLEADFYQVSTLFPHFCLACCSLMVGWHFIWYQSADMVVIAQLVAGSWLDK
jgi:hypothetical protein